MDVCPDRFRFLFLVDRACGFETVGQDYGFDTVRITEPDNQRFSVKARDVIEEWGGVDGGILFYQRMLGPELYQHVPLINMHPSLLPKFTAGPKPLDRMYPQRVRFIGISAHLVTEVVDAGPIVAQVVRPVHADETLAEWHNISYLQKIYLVLVLAELLSKGAMEFDLPNETFRFVERQPYSDRANPRLQDSTLLDAFLTLQSGEPQDAL